MPLLGSESNERPTGLVWRVLKFAMTSAASAAPVERLVYTAVNRIARYGNRALCILATLSVLFAKSKSAAPSLHPGFCMGPYLPLYGVGLCVLAAMAITGAALGLTATVWLRVLLFVLMALMMTIIEYIAGLMALKWLKVRLWDYTNEWGNIGGFHASRSLAEYLKEAIEAQEKKRKA